MAVRGPEWLIPSVVLKLAKLDVLEAIERGSGLE
jgi:hypothetical protein